MKKTIKLIGIAALAAVIVFSTAACRGGGDDDDGGEYWLVSSQSTINYTADGKSSSSSSVDYKWLAYRYSNDTNYEEEYATIGYNDYGMTFSEYHFTRNGQSSNSTTETKSTTRGFYNEDRTITSYTYSTNSSYDSASGLVLSETTVPSGTSSTTYTFDNYGNFTTSNSPFQGTTTGAVYGVKLLSDTGGVKTYEHTPAGGTGYYIYKIKDDRTQEVSYYENGVLMYTTTYTQPDNKEIREKLPKFTLYSTVYHSSTYSMSSSYQTAESSYEAPPNTNLHIRVRTFNDGVLSSETNYTYRKMRFDENGGFIGIASSGDRLNPSETYWGDYQYGGSGYNYEITIFRYMKVGGYANIPAQIDGKPVTSIVGLGGAAVGLYGAFYGCYKLTGVTIPNSVTSIGDNNLMRGVGVFEDCWNLTSITIPASVTSIEGMTFNNCYNLSGITIPDSVINIGSGAFYGTTWFNNQPNGVVYAGKVAYTYKGDSREITSITLLDGTKGIASGAFGSCRFLASITIPASVISIGNFAFSDCTSLTSVTFATGSNIADANFDESAFPGGNSLKNAYSAGKAGTYTRAANGTTWTKQ